MAIGIPPLIKILGDRVDPESRRQIDREKLMIDQSAIILLVEFFGLAVGSVAPHQTAFQTVFGNGLAIDYLLKTWAQSEQIPVFWLKVDQVSEWAQNKLKLHIKDELNAQGKQGQDGIIDDDDQCCATCCEDLSDLSLQQRIDYEFERSTLPALYLDHIIEAMDAHTNMLGTGGIDRYEGQSLRRGEGRMALDI